MEHARKILPFLAILGLGIFLGRGLPKDLGFSGEPGSLTGVIRETMKDALGEKDLQPAYEVDVREESRLRLSTYSAPFEGTPLAASEKEAISVVKSEPPSSVLVVKEKDSVSSAIPTPKEPIECTSASNISPNHSVLINEIAWMGDIQSANHEWIELRNNFGARVSLFNWQIISDDGSLRIVFKDGEQILPGEFFLLERVNDDAVKSVIANKIYSGSLANGGEYLLFYDADCKLVDLIDASHGWPYGSNETKHTLERNIKNFDWHKSNLVGGSPKAKNSEEDSSASFPPPAQNTQGSSPTVNPQPAQSSGAQKILISEIFVGGESSSENEFVELYNAGSETASLTGWTLRKKSSSGSESSLVATSRFEGKTIPPQKYFLIAHDGSYIGSPAPNLTWPSSYSLAYTNNSVVLYDANTNVIEEIGWAEIPKDKSYSRNSWDSNSFSITDPSPQNSGN